MTLLFGILPTLLVGLLITAATGAPPDLIGIASLITAAVGVLAFIASFFRGRRNNERVGEIEDAAQYVKQIDDLTQRLRSEITEIRAEQHSERTRWMEEKRSLEAQLGELRKELNEQVIENYKLRSELIAIKEQIKSYLSPEEYEEFTRHAH